MKEKQVELWDEKLPITQLIPFGIQHVLAMYAGALAVPLIVGKAIGLSQADIAFLIAADLFTCGIATLIQTLGIGKSIGTKLPALMGCSFVSVGPMIVIGNQYGITAIYGAVITAGAILFLCAGLFGKLVKFFPPVVTGTVITTVGLSLMPTAINNSAGGLNTPGYGDPKNLILAGITLIVVIIVNRFLTGFLQAISVLIGLIVGTILAGFMGMLDFSSVSEATWFGFIKPFHFGLPEFKPEAILSMTLVSLVVAIEAIGVFLGLGEICNKEVTEKHIGSGIRGEGLAQVLGGIFNSFPYATFSQNVGLVALSGVKTRWVCVTSGVILVVLGLIPKFAALGTAIPMSVLGGATLAMFGMVAVSGVKILKTVDLTKPGNMLIIAISIGVGLGFKNSPAALAQTPTIVKLLLEDGIVAASLLSLTLNVIFNYGDIKAGKKVDVHADDSVF